MRATLLLVLAACKHGDGASLYHTEDKAPSLDWEDIQALDHMGPTQVDEGVNFAVWSSNATRVDLLLFDDPEAERPTQQLEMVRAGDVWNLYVEGLGNGQHYGYVAWGPNWEYDEAWQPGRIEGFQADVDEAGNRFNPNKLLLDPYAKAVHRDHDWSKGSTGTGPARASSTWGASAKSLIVTSDYTWTPNEAEWREMRRDVDAPGHGIEDLVIYEVHVKGFTMDPASGVDHPGTYKGVGEMAPYLKDLGVTAVELLPIHEKPLDGGYWGYNNLNFFAPELTYSTAWRDRGEAAEVIDEFKEMVDKLHQNDIEVILDVVYNHTGEGGLWREKLFYDDTDLDPTTTGAAANLDPKEVAGLYSFRGLDNAGYYALSADGQTYWNNTGVGNQTRPNHAPTRRMIRDSLRYYVEEMHVDGFRFDLAGILGEKDGDYNTWDDPANTVLQDIIDDPVLQEYNTRVISEPWTAQWTYGPLIGAYPASSNKADLGWMEWNARYRDWWRAFINQDDWRLNSQEGGVDGGFVITGSYDQYAWNGRPAPTSVNFVTCHDGFTMYDLFSFNEKENGCGPLNPVCCDDPTSSWCDTTSGESHNRSRAWGDEASKRQMMRNAFVGMMISHGTPMILGGDEYLRTQYGNNNAYSTQADNEWNWFRWGEWRATTAKDRHRMHDFVREVTRLRREHDYAFAPKTWGSNMPFAWKSEANTDAVAWGSKRVMQHYYDDGNGEYGPELAILINMEANDTVTFTLPGGRTWVRLVDTQRWFDDAGFFDANPDLDESTSWNATLDAPEPVGASYAVPPRTIVVLEDRAP